MSETRELEVVAWAYQGPKGGLIATEEKPAHAPEARALVDLADLVSAQDELDSLKTQLHLKSGILELELDARRKAEAERDALRKALEPFAEAAGNLEDGHLDNSPIWETPAAMGIDARHLRAARKAMEGGE